MSDISINFFATAGEITEWILDWVKLGDIHVVAMHFPPFAIRTVEAHEIAAAVTDKWTSRLCFLTSSPKLPIAYQSDFQDAHSEQMVLDIGRLSNNGLGESWLACRTDNPMAIAIWRKVAKHLRQRTNAGITAINRENGATAYYKSDRYSDGAKALEERGIPMIPIQGPDGPLLRLGRLDEDRRQKG